MEDGRLPADPGVIYRGARVDVGAVIEQQPCRLKSPKLRRHVEQGRSPKEEAAAARAAAVQFRKSAVHELAIRIELLREAMERPPEHFQYARRLYRVVPPAASSTSMQALSRSGSR